MTDDGRRLRRSDQPPPGVRLLDWMFAPDAERARMSSGSLADSILPPGMTVFEYMFDPTAQLRLPAADDRAVARGHLPTANGAPDLWNERSRSMLFAPSMGQTSSPMVRPVFMSEATGDGLMGRETVAQPSSAVAKVRPQYTIDSFPPLYDGLGNPVDPDGNVTRSATRRWNHWYDGHQPSHGDEKPVDEPARRSPLHFNPKTGPLPDLLKEFGDFLRQKYEENDEDLWKMIQDLLDPSDPPDPTDGPPTTPPPPVRLGPKRAPRRR